MLDAGKPFGGVDQVRVHGQPIQVPGWVGKQPQAGKLAAAGLHRVTVSLDSLDEAVFKRMSGGRGDLSRVLAGIDAAQHQ